MVLLDSSVWIAYFNVNDRCHNAAIDILLELKNHSALSEHAYEEVLNVLRIKFKNYGCANFVKFLDDHEVEIVMSDEHILSVANSFFFEHKKLSFSDSLILATAILNDLKLVTFDKEMEKVYSKLRVPR